MKAVHAWDKLWEYLPPVELAPAVGEAVDAVQQSGRWTTKQIEALYALVSTVRDYDKTQREAVEERLRDLIYWEDPDAMKLVYTTEEGHVGITDQEWKQHYEAPTFAEAVAKMHQAWRTRDSR